jgi:Cellulase (glycosyl hydrolase family 5)
MVKEENRAALVSTLLLAAIIVITAGADPGGLFTTVSWSGSHPIATWWWWAPYVVFTPLLLLLNFIGVRSTVLSMLAETPRIWLFFRMWLIVILATAAAWSVNAIFVLYASMAGREYMLTAPVTASFLLWSSGYATLKMTCLGWLPALIGLIRWRSADKGETAISSPNGMATFAAGGIMLLLSVFGPWLARHWWHGSPIGYIYREGPRFPVPVPAPLPDAGLLAAIMALLVCGGVAWVHARGGFARLSRLSQKSAVFAAGGMAGVVAAFALFVVQVGFLLAHGIAASTGADFWFIPEIELLATETCSFALVMAGCGGLAALLGFCLQAKAGAAGAETGRRLNRLGLTAGALGIVALVVMTVRPPELIAKNPAPATAAPLEAAATDGENKLAPISVRRDADHAILSNRYGSQVMLRGVNVNQLGEYYQADPRLAGSQPLTRQDFVDMAALGINSVRLTLSWSKLEPQRGQYSTQYLEQIKQAVSWAAESHVYVVLDIHQDAWSATVVAPKGITCRSGTEPMKGWDGAPAWATLSDDAPACQFTGRDLAPNVSRAFQSFYFDRDGVQTELVNAWAVIAGNFADNANVIGYDLLNEPNFAETPPVTSTLLLANYYARTIAAIRKAESGAAHGYAHPVVIEPSIFWSGFGVDNLPPAGFSGDSQLVYSPHLYNESITSDQDLGINLVSIERGFRLAQHAAAQLHTALWIGEWGFFGDAQQQAGLWDRQANAEDRTQTGSALWIWRQGCGDPHVYPGTIAGNAVRASCPDNQPLEMVPHVRAILQRPYVRSAPGRILQVARNAAGFAFFGETDAASASPALPSCDLEAWVPGTTLPRLNVIEGVTNPRWQRVEPGSAMVGESGGWILRGCVSEKRYHVEITKQPPAKAGGFWVAD